MKKLIIIGILTIIGIALWFGKVWVEMIIWNWIAGHFGLPTVTYWVMFAIDFFISLLFGGGIKNININ